MLLSLRSMQHQINLTFPFFQRPGLTEYFKDPANYFWLLNQYYVACRPKKWQIHSTIFIWHRCLKGKFRVPITKYRTIIDGKRRIVYIAEQANEIKNIQPINDFLAQAIDTNLSLAEIEKMINFAFSQTQIASKLHQIKQMRVAIKINHFFPSEPISNQIFIEIDDAYLPIRAHNNHTQNYRFRTIILHQGVKNHSLINKHIILEILPVGSCGATVEVLSKRILHIIKAVFKLENPVLFLVSDGANWFQKLAEKLAVQSHFLDKWHVKNKIFLAFGNKFKPLKLAFQARFFPDSSHENLVQMFNNYIDDGKIQELIQQVILFKFEYKFNLTKAQLRAVNQLINYLIRKQKLLENYQNSAWIGSHTEPEISHLIKRFNHKSFAVFNWISTQYNILKSLKKGESLFIFTNSNDDNFK